MAMTSTSHALPVTHEHGERYSNPSRAISPVANKGKGKTQVKRPLLIILALLIAVGVPTLTAASPAFAANPVRQVCSTGPGSPTDACWNNWRGYATNNNPVNYYSSGAIYNNWQVLNEGQVVGTNCNPCWPFATGTGLNKRYNGATVYLFEWNLSPRYCLDGGDYNVTGDTGDLKIYQCSTGAPNSNQLFVDDETDRAGDLFINVGASNKASTQRGETYPVWVGCDVGDCGDGQPVEISGFFPYAQNFSLKGAA
jgi:hypothetical protein